MLHLSYRCILLVVLCFIPILSFAQKAYDGQVIDSATEDPIAGVTVKLLKEKITTETNRRGFFELYLEKQIPNDTLQFSSIGYNTFKLPVSQYQSQMFISLEASNTLLNEVRIANKKKLKDIVLGKFTYYDLKDFVSRGASHHTEFIVSRTALAKFFIAPKANTTLRTISLGRQDFPAAPTLALRNAYTNFLIHIMLQDTVTGAPGKILFTKEIALSDNSKLVDIDLDMDKIVIPKTNFFIAIEWENNPYNEIITVSNAQKVERTTKRGWQVTKDAAEYRVYYQPFLVGYDNEKTFKRSLLYIKVNNQWQVCKQYHMGDLALSATVHY
ncbi:carboxypeptidase-like regulatory domain-containing protein [Mucilaginibacter ximonensis]|uniref:Carboxypeptidase-like regulatory domain-containing protein n=1 Tax=Mucilaginibacter ximonensis TaxID=538021 RepID=A0ABW5Y844_9SPHI